MNKQRIGILGGTFDPIHIGHLRLALEVLQTLNLDQVRLIPCHQPPHRQPAIASIEHRLAMVAAAIKNEPQLLLDKREIELPSPSYTINTVISLRRDFPDAAFYLIVGDDAFNQFTTWHQFEKILDYCHVVVANRPHNVGATSTSISSEKIIHYTMRALEISATDIREQFFSGKNPRYLMPDSVYDYIQQHKLYQQKR